MIKSLNNYWKSLRLMLVFFTGSFFALLTIYLNAQFFSMMDKKEITVIILTQSSILILCLGMLVGIFFCKFVHNVLAFEKVVRLPKVLRITEAMTLLHAGTNKEKISVIEYYFLKIYKTTQDLGSEPVKNIDCKEISGFHSWLFYRDDKSRYLGSETVCCDYNEIQKILGKNQEKWCTDERLVIDELQKKSKQLEETLTTITLRENELNEKEKSLLFKEVEVDNLSKANATQHQKFSVQQIEIDEQGLNIAQQMKFLSNQQLEANEKLPIFLDAMRRLAQKPMSPSGFTSDTIREIFEYVANQRGVTSIKDKWVKEFRTYLPTSWCNQGGSPNQSKKQTPPLT